MNKNAKTLHLYLSSFFLLLSKYFPVLVFLSYFIVIIIIIIYLFNEQQQVHIAFGYTYLYNLNKKLFLIKNQIYKSCL